MNIGSPLVISSGIVLNDYFRFINFQAKFYLGGVKYPICFRVGELSERAIC